MRCVQSGDLCFIRSDVEYLRLDIKIRLNPNLISKLDKFDSLINLEIYDKKSEILNNVFNMVQLKRLIFHQVVTYELAEYLDTNPYQLGKLINLEFLDIETTIIETDLINLTKLTYLKYDFSCNENVITNLVNLTEYNGHLIEQKFLLDLPKLKILNLKNKLDYEIVFKLVNLEKVKNIEYLEGLENLERLSEIKYSTKFNEINFKNIQTLEISFVDLDTNTYVQIEKLKFLTNLKLSTLSKITEEHYSIINTYNSLTTLEITGIILPYHLLLNLKLKNILIYKENFLFLNLPKSNLHNYAESIEIYDSTIENQLLKFKNIKVVKIYKSTFTYLPKNITKLSLIEINLNTISQHEFPHLKNIHFENCNTSNNYNLNTLKIPNLTLIVSINSLTPSNIKNYRLLKKTNLISKFHI